MALVIRGLYICDFAYSQTTNQSLNFSFCIGILIRRFIIPGPKFEERICRK
jgi:hypothetical protein